MGKGFLKAYLYLGDYIKPIKYAKILIKDKMGNIIHEAVSDTNGYIDKIPLDAPDITNPDAIAPDFAVYEIEVPFAYGYKKVLIHDAEVFDKQTTIMPIHMEPAIEGYPDKENTIEYYVSLTREAAEGINDGNAAQPMPMAETTNPEIVETMQTIFGNEVAIPEYITVHLGSPNDDSAKNVRLPFKDYLKNVASREIFPTWKEAALTANILAQMTFALNRVYTLYWRSRGKDFDITNSTAFDQAFDPSLMTFESVSNIVDKFFTSFIRRQGRREPFFSSYCNGTTSKCDGLFQVQSQELAVAGYSYMAILKYFYPNDIQIVQSNNFAANVGKYPGYPLMEGSAGENVLRMQIYLNRLSGNWYIDPIPVQNVNGYFGRDTRNSVIMFQQNTPFGLSPDGIIGKGTWNSITLAYIAATRLAELDSEGQRITVGAAPPTVTLYPNTDPVTRGAYVVELQFLLNYISQFFSSIQPVIQNGVFRDDTKRSVIYFQREFGLTPDGVVGRATWQMLYDVYYSIKAGIEGQPPTPEVPPTETTPPFPGTTLQVGSSGSSVMLMQTSLNAIAKVYSAIPTLVPDGAFGPLTETAVRAFQRLFGLTVDGKIGRTTWYKILEVYGSLTAGSTPAFPGTNLTIGSRGSDVLTMQRMLSDISRIFPSVPGLTADGIFGTGTAASVRAFQSLFGLTADGVIGLNTWNKVVYVYNTMPQAAVPVFGGTTLQVGSRGNDVNLMQRYLAAIASRYSSIPYPGAADGIFGSSTQQSVIGFQRQFGLTQDGRIGINTWNKIVSVYNMILMDAKSGLGLSASGTEGRTQSDYFDRYAAEYRD